MAKRNYGSSDDTFKPDPPQKVSFSQVALLFVYHIGLAIFLGYAIYNVWPPQPWPGDSPQARAEARAEAKAEADAAMAAASPSTQNQNTSSAASAVANTNARGVANTNAGRNTNAAPAANQNTLASSAANNTNAITASNPSAVGDAAEPSTAVYGGERPPAFYLFGKKFQPTLEVRLLLLVLLAGAIGSYIHASSSFVDYLGNRTLISSWVWWYLLRPFIGMMLALLFYFVFRGGFITAGVNQGGEAAASFINPFGIAALAGLVGMFSKVAADKLNEVFLTLFAPKAGQGDAKRGDKLTANLTPVFNALAPNVGPAAGGTLITITGSGFVDGATVSFGGVASQAVVFGDVTKLTATTPPHEAGIVDVEVTNPDKSKVSLKGGFTYQPNAIGEIGGEAGDDGDSAGDEGAAHDTELNADTEDEDLPITKGGVE